MPDIDLQSWIRVHSLACASVVVETPDGDASIGSAFHIGGGYYATAKHVLEGNRVLEVLPYAKGYLTKSEMRSVEDRTSVMRHHHYGSIEAYSLKTSQSLFVNEVYNHPDYDVDVSVMKLSGMDESTPVIQLPPFLDESIGALDFVLNSVVMFGYPPVAFSTSAELIVASGEINAVLDTRLDRYLRFVVSTAPRGGFSGAPVLLKSGFIVGMVSHSLERQALVVEMGFTAAISSDAIRDCVDHHQLIIPDQTYDMT